MANLLFTHPEFLVLLVVLPILVVTHLLLFRATKRKGMIFANFETLKRVTGKNPLTKNIFMLVIRLLALTAIILALAGPQIWYTGDAQDTDFVLAIDTSASMTADDLTPNRLEAAKLAAGAFVDSLEDAANVGVIAFSGTVTVEQPLTDDMGAVKQAIERAEVQTVSGTDISGALVTGTNLLLNNDRGRVIILLTDGSSTAGAFRDDPVQRGVEYAKKYGVVVHTIGVGKPDSTLSGYLPRIYNVSAAFSSETLTYIAQQTDGQSLTAANDAQLQEAYQQLQDEGQSTLRVAEPGFWFILFGLVLLFLEWGLANTRFRLIP